MLKLFFLCSSMIALSELEEQTGDGYRTSARRKVFRLMRGDELCGVIVYTWPPPACYGRRMVLPKMTMQELNKNLSTINRVVIHPKYRTIGLGVRLIRETLALVGTHYVELIAVMAKYSPFAEKAGMHRVAVQEPWPGLVKLSEELSSLGFDLTLLGSQRYVMEKIQSLSKEEVERVREVFIRSPHPRFRQEVNGLRHLPWGPLAIYVAGVRGADLEKLARFVRIAGLLLQTKVYLFWRNEED